jgi:hypothetical protein
MKAQPHSWMEYQYRFAGANDNYKMWVRDDERIHQVANGAFVPSIQDQWFEQSFNTFEEAQKFLDMFANDKTPL